MTQLLTKHLIDLSHNPTTAQALMQFEQQVSGGSFDNNTVSIVLGELVFIQGHMARLKTLAQSRNVEIEVIYASAVQTQLAALNSSLTVSEKAPGEKILESFRDSLNNISDMNSDSQPENIIDEEPLTQQAEEMPQVIFEECCVDSEIQEQIVSVAEDNESSEVTTLDDVVEILNSAKEMVQHKIDLPFEKLNDNNVVTRTNKMTTLYISQTLRSGQVVTHSGNVIIAGDTHPGSEVVAGGDIIVWGTLSGIAHAGAGNNYKASIRSLKMNPIQLRIADYIARRPDLKTDFNTELPLKPEVARISNGEIKIFSLK